MSEDLLDPNPGHEPEGDPSDQDARSGPTAPKSVGENDHPDADMQQETTAANQATLSDGLEERRQQLETVKLKREVIKLRREIVKLDQDIGSNDVRLRQDTTRWKNETIRLVAIALISAVVSLVGIQLSKHFDHSEKESDRIATARENERKFQRESLQKFIEDFGKAEVAAQPFWARSICGVPLPPSDTALRVMQVEYCKLASQAEVKTSKDTLLSTATENLVTNSPMSSLVSYDTVLSAHDRQESAILQRIKSTDDHLEVLRLQDSLRELDKRLDAAIQANPELVAAVQATAQVQQAIQRTDSMADRLQQQIAPRTGTRKPTAWLKEDYFLVFDNFKVVLIRLNGRSSAEMAIYRVGGSRDPIQTGVAASGSPLSFAYEKRHYRINLERIDHAGKNPFTLAAYITFETLN